MELKEHQNSLGTLADFFKRMHDIDFPYVVLRNWENLPYKVEFGEHGDLDLLVYDIEHWMEVFPQAKRVHKHPRVQFKVPIGNSFVMMDIRNVGDGYYPEKFQKEMLETREWWNKGFYTPNPVFHRVALAYHAVHHKNFNNYKKWLGDTKIEDLLEALKKGQVGWCEPDDPTVGRFNAYWKGATSTVEKKGNRVVKKQNNFGKFNLTENEHRILKEVNSIHFPKVFEQRDGEIEIEHCGKPLTHKNLPDDWRGQFSEILEDLKEHCIEHRDIRPDNLMVSDGIIKLIDFGWARFKDDPKDNPPSCLGKPYKPSWGFDDAYSLRQIQKQMEFKCES